MTAIGTMRQRVTLQEPVDTDDGGGGFTRQWQDGAALWAAMEPATARQRFEAGQAGVTVTHRLTIRYRPGVTSAHRLRLGTRIFDIRHLHADEQRRFIHITAEEHLP
jgi:SPP1 family predicted phage head-tail adaptor